jgi:hypothetical protein
MSQNNTGLSWVSDEDAYFLRDDEAMDLCDFERYSLFRHWPDYGRVVVLRGPLKWAITEALQQITDDKQRRGCKRVPVFIDEQL